jgi:hypothetical protein
LEGEGAWLLKTRTVVLSIGFLLTVIAPTAQAGGDEWWVRVREMSRKGRADATVQLLPISPQEQLGQCSSLVVDIAYQWAKWFFRLKSPVSYSGHRAALDYLADARRADKPILFGVIGGTPAPDDNHPCHFLSGGLALEQDEAGATHVFSFHDWD